MLDLERLLGHVLAPQFVCSDLIRGQRGLVGQHLQLELGHLQSVECFKDGILNLSLIELTLHGLVLVVLESIQVCLDLLLQLVGSDLGFSVFVLLLEQSCLASDFVFVIGSVHRTSSIRVILVHCFPELDLALVKQVIVVHQLQVLQVVGVAFLDRLVTVCH